jgi:8-oxo-dGTP pyrophosphatase MutT (NUDIX family)
MNVAATFLIRDDKILLLRRGDTAPWMPGKWDLPGGQVEELPPLRYDGGSKKIVSVYPTFETIEETALRELYEETGVGANVYDLMAVTTIKVEGEPVTFFRLHAWTDEPEFNPDEHQDQRWVTMKEAFRMDVVPGIKRALTIMGSPGFPRGPRL